MHRSSYVTAKGMILYINKKKKGTTKYSVHDF